MVKVVVAGGSGNVGKMIIDAILAIGNQTPIIFSRSGPKPTDPPNVEVRTVDYSSHTNLVSALKDVHTVIVTLFSADAKESEEHQLALLEAAKEASVKRFAPSEWASKNNSGLAVYLPKVKVWEAVKKSGLEVTRFVPGLFINVFAGGSNLPNESSFIAGYAPANLFIDARAGTADIPGDGTTKLTFTSVQDTAKFVAASLDLDTWEELSGIVGETVTFEKVVDVMEKITGKKFVRTHLNGGGERAEKLLESPLYSECAKSIAAGHWEVEPTLNRRLPHLRALTVEEFLRKYWEGADWST